MRPIDATRLVQARRPGLGSFAVFNCSVGNQSAQQARMPGLCRTNTALLLQMCPILDESLAWVDALISMLNLGFGTLPQGVRPGPHGPGAGAAKHQVCTENPGLGAGDQSVQQTRLPGPGSPQPDTHALDPQVRCQLGHPSPEVWGPGYQVWGLGPRAPWETQAG